MPSATAKPPQKALLKLDDIVGSKPKKIKGVDAKSVDARFEQVSEKLFLEDLAVGNSGEIIGPDGEKLLLLDVPLDSQEGAGGVGYVAGDNVSDLLLLDKPLESSKAQDAKSKPVAVVAEGIRPASAEPKTPEPSTEESPAESVSAGPAVEEGSVKAGAAGNKGEKATFAPTTSSGVGTGALPLEGVLQAAPAASPEFKAFQPRVDALEQQVTGLKDALEQQTAKLEAMLSPKNRQRLQRLEQQAVEFKDALQQASESGAALQKQAEAAVAFQPRVDALEQQVAGLKDALEQQTARLEAALQRQAGELETNLQRQATEFEANMRRQVVELVPAEAARIIREEIDALVSELSEES